MVSQRIEVLVVDHPTAAEMLGISERYLHTLVKRGEVPSFKWGRARRYSRKALSEYVDRKAREGEVV